MLVAPSARQGCSITKTDKWLKLLTLPLPISKCLQVSTMFASLTAGLRKKVLTKKWKVLFCSNTKIWLSIRNSDWQTYENNLAGMMCGSTSTKIPYFLAIVQTRWLPKEIKFLIESISFNVKGWLPLLCT